MVSWVAHTSATMAMWLLACVSGPCESLESWEKVRPQGGKCGSSWRWDDPYIHVIVVVNWFECFFICLEFVRLFFPGVCVCVFLFALFLFCLSLCQVFLVSSSWSKLLSLLVLAVLWVFSCSCCCYLTSSLTRYFVDDKDKKAPHVHNHSHDLDSSAFWDHWNTQTSVKVAPKNRPTLSISYFICFPILQLKMKLLQAPWTARIRRLPTLMPLTSKRSARNAKHMAMTVVWVPFFRRRGKMTSNNDEVWQKMDHSWHCWQVCGLPLNAKNWLNLILDDVKRGRSCATHMWSSLWLIAAAP